MPLRELLPVGEDTAQWTVWGTTARLVVTDPARLAAARSIVDAELSTVDRAASRFRGDSEVHRVRQAGGRPVRVSPVLAELVAAALWAARRTDGDVDPTVGDAMVRLGYDQSGPRSCAGRPGPVDDRDLSLLHDGLGWRVARRPAPGWQRVHLDGRVLTVPAGVLLDLGATAKAYTADRCARLVADAGGTGVLVSLGGDIATAGPAPEGGWRVLVQDRPGDPHCTVALPAGTALATSSTVSRRWRAGDVTLHHILDPRTGLPARPVWRTVSVAAHRCLKANAFTTAATVRGEAAVDWLRGLGVPARLVRADGRVLTVGGWPS